MKFMDEPDHVPLSVKETPLHMYVMGPHPRREDESVVIAEINGPREVALTNAHFIADACNNHYSLLSACEAALTAIRFYRPNCDSCETEMQLIEAINKAGETEPTAIEQGVATDALQPSAHSSLPASGRG
jgi:hypothetical protein